MPHIPPPRVCTLLFMALFIVPAIQAQGSPNEKVAVPRDATAVALLEKVVATMGGYQALSGARNSTHRASVVSLSSQGTSNNTATWTNSGSSHSFHSGDGDQFPHIQYDDMSGGRLTRNGETRQLPSPVAEAYFDPFDIALLLSRSLANTEQGLIDNGSMSKDGIVVDKITITSRIGPRTVRKTVLVDLATYLPLELDFCIPALSPPSACRPQTYRFSGFQRQSGILYPAQVTLSDSRGLLQAYSLLYESPTQ